MISTKRAERPRYFIAPDPSEGARTEPYRDVDGAWKYKENVSGIVKAYPLVTMTLSGVQTGDINPAVVNTIYPIDVSGAAGTSDLAITLPTGSTNDEIWFYDQTKSATATRTITATGLIQGVAANIARIEGVGTSGEVTLYTAGCRASCDHSYLRGR